MEELLKDKFDGSSPDFLAAFIRKGKLSDKDIEDLQAMIDNLRTGV
jgi:predicted transcriptional regulator